MRILVTGSTGFLGKNLVPKLLNKGYDLLLPTRDDLNLLDSNSVSRFFDNHKFTHIIHLAAVAGGIGINREKPYSFIAQNQQINLNVMNSAIKHNMEKVVTIGSVCAYPKLTPVPFREVDIWNGKPEHTNLPYGQSKRDLMVMCEAAYKEYGLNAVHLIPTNLYGNHDNFDLNTSHVIPALIHKMLTQNSIEIWGTGLASRDFLHVDDCCDAIIKSLETNHSYEPINLGSGNEVSISELVDMLVEITGFSGTIKWNSNKPDGQPRRRLDITRANDILNWQSKIAIVDGLRDLVQWYGYQLEPSPSKRMNFAGKQIIKGFS